MTMEQILFHWLLTIKLNKLFNDTYWYLFPFFKALEHTGLLINEIA